MDLTMIRVGLAGVGKMGLSHLALLKANPNVNEVVVCEPSGYIRSVISRYTKTPVFADYGKMISDGALDAVVIATPSRLHAAMVRSAVEAGIHVFCEKPFSLNPFDSMELTEMAHRANLVNQVGYHNRFIGTFVQARDYLSQSVLGDIHHVRIEAFGPVVTKKKGTTWRSRSQEGGGSLFDYACHALDLVQFLVGSPVAVSGAVLGSVYSEHVDDEVYATLHFNDGSSGQLAVNWADESFRKMFTQFSAWGSNGRLIVDRQELRTYLREPRGLVPKGWHVSNTTELTSPTAYYLRGEEYTAQIDTFIDSVISKTTAGRSTFETAAETDRVVAAIRSAAASGGREELPTQPNRGEGSKLRSTQSIWGKTKRLFG